MCRRDAVGVNYPLLMKGPEQGPLVPAFRDSRVMGDASHREYVGPPRELSSRLSGQIAADLPAQNPHPTLHYHFCNTCSVRAFARGNQEALGGACYAIAIASLDNPDPGELAALIKYVDGRHDRYDQAPEDTRLM